VTITLTCTRCREPITARDEDDLVAQVQAHARDHGGAQATHVPTREHILARHHQDTTDPAETGHDE
jgi:hypothetical protein